MHNTYYRGFIPWVKGFGENNYCVAIITGDGIVEAMVSLAG
jgi:hypothetical protein